jgi:ribosome recycling factor
MAEEARVRIRNARKTGMDAGKAMKNDNVLTEDSQKDFEAEVQEKTDKFVKKIDTMSEEKEAEVMAV